jgi:LacI family transcriptional regulator
MAGKVTLTDVARVAGVGIATVSRALGDHPDTSAATRDRIRSIARELGYRPSVTARALRTGGFHAISAIVPDTGWGWWEPVVIAAFQAASAQGYHLMVHPIAGVEGGVASVVEGLANVPTEGVILISVADQDGVRAACDRISLPAVAIDDTSRHLRFPAVSPRNRAGAHDAVTHLIENGRRDIVLLRGDTAATQHEWGDGLFLDDRVAGYADALGEAAIPYDPELDLRCADPFDETKATWPELDRLLSTGRRVDGVFCIADLMAAPALRTLRRHGLRVPEDVAVVGFDDERAAQLYDPQLTTVRQPYDEMGRTSVEMLLRMIAGETVPEERHELSTALVVRESTLHRSAD